jgi:2-isopropylmalate synthase
MSVSWPDYFHIKEQPMRKIMFFDTTLRDGLKSPGTILSIDEKVRIAKQLARLRVDVLEVGFPAASQEQFDTAERIAGEVEGPILAVLARANNPRDFEIAWKAIQHYPHPRLHTFVPASREYRDHFLKKDAAATVELAVSAIRKAKEFTPDVEFTLMDAFRANPQRVLELVSAAAQAGAATINLADTVGYATPFDVGKLFLLLRNEVEQFNKVVFSVHCHNDLGLAVANSLAALAEGARQIHCTVNGIGERAGNAPLEELAAILSVHGDRIGAQLNVQLDRIYPTSRLVRRLTGAAMGHNKPVVGEDAFNLEVVVPQLSDTEEKAPYETLHPEKLGVEAMGNFLTAATSFDEFQNRLMELGYQFEGSPLEKLYANFKELTGKKENIFDADLELLVSSSVAPDSLRYRLHYLNVTAGSISVPNATVQLEVDGQLQQDAGFGDGPVDAAFKTILKMIRRSPKLIRYEVTAITPGSDAQGEATIGLEEGGYVVTGRAAATDIILASAKALIDGLNKLDRLRGEAVISEYTGEEGWMPLL